MHLSLEPCTIPSITPYHTLPSLSMNVRYISNTLLPAVTLCDPYTRRQGWFVWYTKQRGTTRSSARNTRGLLMHTTLQHTYHIFPLHLHRTHIQPFNPFSNSPSYSPSYPPSDYRHNGHKPRLSAVVYSICVYFVTPYHHKLSLLR